MFDPKNKQQGAIAISESFKLTTVFFTGVGLSFWALCVCLKRFDQTPLLDMGLGAPARGMPLNLEQDKHPAA